MEGNLYATFCDNGKKQWIVMAFDRGDECQD